MISNGLVLSTILYCIDILLSSQCWQSQAVGEAYRYSYNSPTFPTRSSTPWTANLKEDGHVQVLLDEPVSLAFQSGCLTFKFLTEPHMHRSS